MTAEYCGRWTLARSIADLRSGGVIRCSGWATLRPEAGGALVYDEAVSYRVAGKLIRATRTYRYVSANGSIVATFGDGRPFFSLRLDDGGGSAVHHCGTDRYRLRLTLPDRAAWRTQWNVSGTKSLRIVTDYARGAFAGQTSTIAP